MTRAVAQARERAATIARVAGLALGDVQLVAERDLEAEAGFIAWRPGRPVATTVAVTFATQQTTAAQTTGRATTAVGLGRSRVRPRDRRSNASIRAAVMRARLRADEAAVRDAVAEAQRLAAASGAVLGVPLALAERHRVFDDPGIGSFGPGRYCGPYRRAIVRRDPRTGRRRVVRRVTERRCFFPSRAMVALRITYAS